MGKLIRNFSAAALSLAMFFGMFAGAAEAAAVETEQQMEVMAELEDFPTNDELFACYVENLLYGDLYEDSASYGTLGSEKLNTKESKAVYEAVKTQIQKIAAGEQESTEIYVTGTLTWTAEELGVSQITQNNFQYLAVARFVEVVDMEVIMEYLLMDCPYDLYWYDKTVGADVDIGLQMDAKKNTVSISPLVLRMPVAAEYQNGSLYKMNTSLVQKAKNAKAKAEEIVAQNKGKTEYQKLTAYKNVICDMVDYNDDVVDDENYGNPWQLIWVFDGDESTKVVCEGYTKAFQYLCDLSGLECYCVTGYTSGPHMWNIVRLEGNNYLVDVTNCDKGSIGYPNKLFLAGTNLGNVNRGYTFQLSENIDYIYYPEQSWIIGNDILQLAEENYVPRDVFPDVSSTAWYADAVRYVYDTGLMSGNNGLFKPTETVTRAVVVTTLYRLAGSPNVTDTRACRVFKDVPVDRWYTDAICWAYATGGLTGNPTTMQVDVTSPVTRQQLATFFFRYAEYAGMDTSVRGDISKMKNADQVKSYALEAMQWAVGTGLISGSEVKGADGKIVKDLAPLKGASRAQLATILQRFCE